MLDFFKRLLRIFKAEGNSALDKIEDPIKLTEKGIDTLKKDLTEGLRGLAEAKALAVRTRREVESQKKAIAKYESQAVLLLEKAGRGEITQEKADQLATHALEQKANLEKNIKSGEANMKTYQELVTKMESQTTYVKNEISKYENELRTLKARSKVSSATAKINKQLSQVDSRSTVALLEKMKEKVQEQEALPESYSEMAEIANKTVDDEVENILGAGPDTAMELSALKEKLRLSENSSADVSENNTQTSASQSNEPQRELSDLEKLKQKLQEGSSSDSE